MDEIDEQLKLMQKWHWDNFIHYDRAISRYLLISGGVSIGLILNFLKNVPHSSISAYQGCISIDTAIWLFTFNILISGVCIWLNSQFSTLNVNNFSYLLGYNSGGNDTSDQIIDKLSDLHKERQIKVKKYWKLINWLQFASAILFVLGLLISVYLATRII